MAIREWIDEKLEEYDNLIASWDGSIETCPTHENGYFHCLMDVDEILSNTVEDTKPDYNCMRGISVPVDMDRSKD